MRTTKKISKKGNIEEFIAEIQEKSDGILKDLKTESKVNVLEESKEEPIKNIDDAIEKKKMIEELSKLHNGMKETANELDPYGEEDWGDNVWNDGKKIVFDDDFSWSNRPKAEKKVEKKFTEDDLKESISNASFVKDVMSKFTKKLNEENAAFVNLTKKAEETNYDDSPNVFVKLSPFKEEERVIFKDKLLLSGEKRRPIYLTIGDYDFFYEYIDTDSQAVFSFNKKSFDFFFGSDVERLRSYIGKNRCSFSGMSRYSDKTNKFSDLVVEMVERKKKKVQEKVQETPKPVNINKKICKVKFFNSDPLFILTEDPATIFQKYINEVHSIKIVGEGILI